MSALVACAVIKATILVALLNAPSSCSSPSNEDADHTCRQHSDGGWALCDTGRCCGYDNKCSEENCAQDRCQFYCPSSSSPLISTQGRDGGVEVLARALVDAARNQYYLDREINDDAVASSSPPSSSVLLLSCAPSLSRLSPAGRQRYPWAALGDAASFQSRNNITAICGQCLKVTAVGAGGVHNQVKVRIVHTPTIKGLELDHNTFRKLNSNGRGTYNRLTVKYQFESC